MQLAYVPVGKMFYEGALRLHRARVTLPRMQRGTAGRVGVEAYPGLVARKVLGRESYKNDPRGVSRVPARARLVERDADGLDAVLAALQAAWSASMPGHGLPRRFDALEGWIADPETLR